MDIVMVPFHDYKKWINEGFRTRDAHLCQHFERHKLVDKILVVNRPISLAESLLKRKGWKTQTDSVIFCRNGIQLSKMSENVWCIDFMLLDFLKVGLQKKMWWFTAFKYQKVIDGINEAIKYLDMKDSVLLLQNPMAIGVVKGVKNKSFVFDAIDNWLYHPQMQDKHLIKNNYEYVDKNADLILTVSEALTKTFPTNSNVHWVPNGVDVDYFSEAIELHINAKSPVVGYVGKIQDRVDFDLVEICLKAIPDAKFEFLGPVYTQQERVKQLAEKYMNIAFIGDVHYSRLPEAMRAFDVAIIPHKIDDFTASMNPLKLYEYLAAGKVVVTTDVAGTANISQYVYSANDKDTFVKLLEKAISVSKSGNIEVEEVVNSIPDDCCWTSRVDTILELFGTI